MRIDGTSGNDDIQGDSGYDSYYGGNSDDTILGGLGDDVIRGGLGSDTIDGGDGRDTALFYGKRGDYSVVVTKTGVAISGPDGADQLINVERIHFDDFNMAFDIEGDAGQAYRLYQAAFSRTPDLSGLGYQMKALDDGLTLSQVAANFIASPEFQRTYGNVDDAQFITLLYHNVLHRDPDSGGMEFHRHELTVGETRADLLNHFSESLENQANVIGAIQDGILYLL